MCVTCETQVTTTHQNGICHTFTLVNMHIEISLLRRGQDMIIIMSSYSVQRFCLLSFHCCIYYKVLRCQICLHGAQIQQLFKQPGWRKAIGGHGHFSVKVTQICETKIILK